MDPNPYWTLGNCKKYLDDQISEMLNSEKASVIKPIADIFKPLKYGSAISCGIIIGTTINNFVMECYKGKISPKKIEFAIKEEFERRLPEIIEWYELKSKT